MTTAPGELTASSVIGLIETGAYPRDIVATIARGFLPLEQNDLISVLAYLGLSEDEEIRTLARTSLGDLPPHALAAFATNEELDPAHLARLLSVSGDAAVIEALIRNRAVPDAAVLALARRIEIEAVQEVIVINQARILRSPEILDALLENPKLSGDAKRRALETREEFFVKKARLQELAEFQEPDLVDAPLDEIADLLEKAAAEFGNEPTAPPPLTELEKKDDRPSVVWTRLQFMSVSEKVQLAYKGDRMIRMLLVRDRNKLISSAVMRNPRMTEQEAESIAGMRNVEEDVLRILASRRAWASKYNIMLTLCRNPKSPVGVVLPFVSRLTLRDLKGLKDDRGVQAVVRELAKKLYVNKAQKA